jgi:hypothetical protein
MYRCLLEQCTIVIHVGPASQLQKYNPGSNSSATQRTRGAQNNTTGASSAGKHCLMWFLPVEQSKHSQNCQKLMRSAVDRTDDTAEVCPTTTHHIAQDTGFAKAHTDLLTFLRT